MNQKWVTDVTEFNVAGQKLYLSPVMDLHNGEIVAFETARRPDFKLVQKMTAGSRMLESRDIVQSVSQGKLPRQRRHGELLRHSQIRALPSQSLRQHRQPA